MQSQQEIINQLINARYRRNVTEVFEALYKNYPDTAPKDVLHELRHVLSSKPLTKNITPQVLNNQEICRGFLYTKIDDLLNEHVFTKDHLHSFFREQKRVINFALGKWLCVNAFISLEPYIITASLPPNFLLWLEKEFDVVIGDFVAHRHIIPTEERPYLGSLGISVPGGYLTESIYDEAMRTSQEMLKADNKIKGVFSEGSWIYNPQLFENAPDGRPFVAFTFFKEAKYSGHIYYLGHAEENSVDYQLATKNPRRKAYVEAGVLKINKYGTFIPRDEVLGYDYS